MAFKPHDEFSVRPTPDAYPGGSSVAIRAKGVTADVLRRHLVAWGGFLIAGVPVEGIGEFIDDLGDPDPVPLPTQLELVHVAQIKDLTQRLEDAARTFGSDPVMSSAAAARAERWLKVSGPESVKQAMVAAVAGLQIHAGVAAFVGGLYQRTLRHLARALELAKYVDNPALQAEALAWAGLATVEHGHPDDGLKMLQGAQVKSWDIPNPDQRALREACILMDSATAWSELGQPQQAYRHVGKSRELWTPSAADPFGDLDRPVALLELKQGRFDRAAQFAAASVRQMEGVSERGRVRSRSILATAYVRAGEPRGLQLAHSAITDTTKLTSVRARRRLVTLAEALEARPGTDARDLARLARQAAA